MNADQNSDPWAAPTSGGSSADADGAAGQPEPGESNEVPEGMPGDATRHEMPADDMCAGVGARAGDDKTSGDAEKGEAEDTVDADSSEVDPGTAGTSGIDRAVAEAFETELAEARRKADENWDRYLRAEADLENVRRRSSRLRDEAVERQRRDLLSRFLDVADNLERALSFADSDPAALAEGVDATHRELSKILASEGVEPIAAMDAPFDPDLHEAVGVVPVPDATEDRVVSVDRTGYTVGGELLRPARVIVGQSAGRPAGGG